MEPHGAYPLREARRTPLAAHDAPVLFVDRGRTGRRTEALQQACNGMRVCDCRPRVGQGVRQPAHGQRLEPTRPYLGSSGATRPARRGVPGTKQLAAPRAPAPRLAAARRGAGPAGVGVSKDSGPLPE
jgi:hypothetical protein